MFWYYEEVKNQPRSNLTEGRKCHAISFKRRPYLRHVRFLLQNGVAQLCQKFRPGRGQPGQTFSDEPVDYLLETLGRRDEYPSESFVLYVGGSSCAVESETLYKALLSLPEKQRNVLLLDFWGDLSDREISEKMEVTPRTVYNLRQRAFSKIREFYEKRGRDP